MSGWAILGSAVLGSQHVIPLDDLITHELSPTCECKPAAECVPMQAGMGFLWGHNALDGREAIEDPSEAS